MSRTVLSLALLAALSLYSPDAFALEVKVVVETKETKETKGSGGKYDYEKPVTGGVTPKDPVKEEPKDPGKDPGKEEPGKDPGEEDPGAACVDPGTELVETGEPGVVQIVLDPDFGGANNCTCYDVDAGDNPGIPGGVAVSCDHGGGGQTFRNLSQKDGMTPGGTTFREYVCGFPPGSNAHLTNAGVVMMSYYEYNMPDPVQWGPNNAQPDWTNRFFGDQFAFTSGSATHVGGTPPAACEGDEDEDVGKEEPGKEEPSKEEPGKGEPSKGEPSKEVGKGTPEKTKPMTKEEMIKAEALAKAAAEAAAEAAAALSKEKAPVVIKVEVGKKL